MSARPLDYLYRDQNRDRDLVRSFKRRMRDIRDQPTPKTDQTMDWDAYAKRAREEEGE
jgi:hypothetical protein